MRDQSIVDDVAARMTAIDPPADLRARVIARLPARTRGARWARRWTIVPIAAAATVVIVATMVWPRFASRSHDAASAGPVSTATIAMTTAATTTPASAGDATPIVKTPAARARRAAPDHLVDPGLPALARPDAVTIDAIQPAGLAIAQLQVVPIVTERLRMPPVDANGAGR